MSDAEKLDRELWKVVRAALMLMLDAIDRRYGFGKFASSRVVQLQPTDSVGGSNIAK